MSKLGRWLPLAAVLGLLGAAMFAAVYANPVIDNLPPATRTFTPPADQSYAPPPPPETTRSLRPPGAAAGSIPQWVTWVLTGLCMAAVLAVIVALLWATLRDRLLDRKVAITVTDVDDAARQQLQQRVRAAVDEGLADLDDADMDPRRAVIACWVRLEDAAAAAGTPRSPGDTSTELVGRLLATHAVSEEVLAGFAEVYRAARFATHAVDPAMREQARFALGLLRDQLIAGIADSARRAAAEPTVVP